MSEPDSAAVAARQEAANPSAHREEHGWHNTTPVAWVIVFVIIAAFGLGGAALIIWNFILFWIAVAIIILGVGFGWAVGLMDMVEEYGTGPRGGDPQATVPF